DRGAARPDPAITATLVAACADRRVVTVGYRSEAGREWDAVVEPWAVVVPHGRWYLLCRATDRDAVRTSRVDRVHSATVGTDTFTPPAPLDPVAALEPHLGAGWGCPTEVLTARPTALAPVEALETHLGAGWDYPTEVLIDGPLELCQGYLPRTLGRLSEVDEGTTRLAGTTSNAYGYAESLVRLPVPYRVVGGPQLRDAVRELGERMLAAVHD